jgi:hypothetical protein
MCVGNGIAGSGFIGAGPLDSAVQNRPTPLYRPNKMPHRPGTNIFNHPDYHGIFPIIMALDGSDDDFHHIFANAFSTGITMSDQSHPNSCADDTQQITIHLPCRLAERADKYASDNGSTITNVVIEALDAFLSGRKMS